MKKPLTIFLLSCVALALAYGAASYWVGERARQQYDQMVERINQTNYLKGSTKSYERGLFSSKALTTFTLVLPEGGDAIQFSLVNSIYHGPLVLLMNPHVKVGLRPALAEVQMRLVPGESTGALKKVLEKIPELESSEISVVILYDGGGESYLEVPPFKKTVSDDKGGELKLEWGGFTGKFKYDPPLGHMSGSFGSPFLQITEQGDQLRIKDIQADFNSRPGVKGITVGSTAISIGSIEGAEQDNASFNLTSLGIKAESAVTGETINASFGLSFDKLDAGGLGLGPSVMEFEARKLDPEVLSHLQGLVLELERKTPGKTDSSTDEIDALFRKTILDLLVKSPEFEIKQLRAKTDKGDLSGTAKVAFASGKDVPEKALAILGSIDASAELSVAEALLFFTVENAIRSGSKVDAKSAKASANGLVLGLMAAKYITLENGSFKSSATFKRGVLTVNGHKLDLSRLH